MTVTQIGTKQQASWFGRDPVAFIGLLSTAVVAVVVLVPGIPDGAAALIGALVLAGGGVVIAFTVLRDGQVAAIVGFFKAGMLVLVVLGFDIPSATQMGILVAVEAVGAVIVGKRVVVPLNADGTKRTTDEAAALAA